MKEIFLWLKSSGVWWRKNANAIIAICAVISLAIPIIAFITRTNSNEIRYDISVKPNVKIKSVYLKVYPYQEFNGPMSDALKFFIPIKNEGDATAYNIKIIKKELRLVRSPEPYNLDTPSLQTLYTSSPFELKSGETIEDNIFIDETPANVEKVLNGEESFLLKYVIYFYADKKSKTEPFIYEYETKFSKSQFQVVSESLHQDIKP